MNDTAIEWCSKTWNPITGCRNNCEYCYARKLAETRLRGRCGYPQDDPFKPTYHPNRLMEPLNLLKPAKIFTVSMGDMFSDEVNPDWVRSVMDIMYQASHHTYIVLTKRPDRIIEVLGDYILPSNLWMGVSITSCCDQHLIEELHFQLDNMKGKTKKIVSIEPILGPVTVDMVGWDKLDWVIIGAETGHRRGKVTPEASWVHDILDHCMYYKVPVFTKDSLLPQMGTIKRTSGVRGHKYNPVMDDKARIRMYPGDSYHPHSTSRTWRVKL